MTSTGGPSRRARGRAKRSTYIQPAQNDARAFRRKNRKGWAAWLG